MLRNGLRNGLRPFLNVIQKKLSKNDISTFWSCFLDKTPKLSKKEKGKYFFGQLFLDALRNGLIYIFFFLFRFFYKKTNYLIKKKNEKSFKTKTKKRSIVWCVLCVCG